MTYIQGAFDLKGPPHLSYRGRLVRQLSQRGRGKKPSNGPRHTEGSTSDRVSHPCGHDTRCPAALPRRSFNPSSQRLTLSPAGSLIDLARLARDAGDGHAAWLPPRSERAGRRVAGRTRATRDMPRWSVPRHPRYEKYRRATRHGKRPRRTRHSNRVRVGAQQRKQLIPRTSPAAAAVMPPFGGIAKLGQNSRSLADPFEAAVDDHTKCAGGAK